MPRTSALRVQDAAKKTRWTLTQDSSPLRSPTATDSIMQANGYHHHPYDQRDAALPRYSDYDGSHYGGSQYSVASGQESDMDWKPPQAVNGGDFGGFDFHHTPMNEVTALNLDTHVRTPQPDGVGRHLLYETALMDTQHFDILDIGEVDALKKEQARLNSRIEATQRKLALESKVRDAAQNLQRLYSTNKRPDTPQSPESPNKKRNSLLPGSRNRSGSNNGTDTFRQADSELTMSVRKVDELNEQIKDLLNRRQEVERKLLRHTAAVLAEEANRVVDSAVPGVTNGHHYEDDYIGSYAYNDFDGIRDILQGKAAGASNTSKQYEEQFSSMQSRLEQLNHQLRNVISEAGQTLGRTPTAEIGLDQSEEPNVRIENRFSRIEQNLHTLEQQQRDFRAEAEQNLQMLDQLERDARSNEEQMEGVNRQLHNTLLQASDSQPVPGLREPPSAAGHGYQVHLQYMEETSMTLEQLIQQNSQSAELLDAQAKATELSKKNSDYEATVSGLWDILQSDAAPPAGGQDEEAPSTPPTKESFSLSAFSSKVQLIFDRAQSAREQQDILRRQIQQQRELGGKSDMEKDRQIAEIQGKHDQLASEHGGVQQELANLMVKHEQTEGEANQSRSELMKVMDEVEELKRTIDTKSKERDELDQRATTLQQQLQEQSENESAAESKHNEMHHNMEKLETEVVRLTTELTMAKAELDSAYGTRAERAGAQAAEVDSLNAEVDSLTTKNKDMESALEDLRTELQEMTTEYQEMTAESVALEKERKQLDTLIDGLRDRCDALETQVNDEKVARIGLQQTEEKEARSMLVLKQEFKKMMRELKAEGVKAMRVEQDERRKLEAELRKLRQANGPLGKSLQSSSRTATPV